jgi:hypothetical protein
VELKDAELDAVAAGALLNVAVIDLVDVNDVNVAIPVTAAVTAQVGVLSNQVGGAAAGAPGIIRQV